MVVSEVTSVVSLIPTLEPVALVTGTLTSIVVTGMPGVLVSAVSADGLPLMPVLKVVSDDTNVAVDNGITVDVSKLFRNNSRD